MVQRKADVILGSYSRLDSLSALMAVIVSMLQSRRMIARLTYFLFLLHTELNICSFIPYTTLCHTDIFKLLIFFPHRNALPIGVLPQVM